MSKGKSQNLIQATLLAESTVDNIISQGANRLYDNYIKTKIPKNVRSSLEKVIETGFNLFVSNTCNNRNQIKHIHQKEIQKTNIVEEKRKIGSQVNAQKQKYSLSARNTIQVDSRVVKNGASKQVRSNKCHQRKRQSKVTSDCVPNFSEDSSSFQQKEQIDKIWVQRQQRLKQQLLREQQQKKTEQKNSSIKKRLQQQIRELQEKNKTITFNHHTGRIFRLDEHHQFNNQTNKWHKNIIRLKFGLTDKQDLCRKISQSKQLMVRNSRKITSFQRKRRKINFIDENVDDSSYNNNGKRQTSNFLFLEMQEGVHIAQGGNAKLSNNDSKIRKTRINSASLSHHQTFKSYTKEKIETSRCFKTIATAPSTAKTRYAKDDDKYLNKAVNTAKQSILSSQGVQFKNHKISKNAELMENYFSLNQEY